MPGATTVKKTKSPPTKAAKPATAKKPATRTPAARMTLDEAMRALEDAGSAQTRKTYARHGADEPMFGVSFAVLKTLHKRIRVDHELACALWDTGNFDARNLAVKIVDPSRMSPAELDRWARETSTSRMCGGYAAMLAAEGPHGPARATEWLAAEDAAKRAAGWTLLGQLAQRDEALPDAWFHDQLAAIERRIHEAPNREREVMNQALIAIGCRNAALRKAATAAAKRIGKVEVDHGDTACKTPDAAGSIDKTWEHSLAKGFVSPAAHERTRDSPRTRC
jgi:3-methyladenine DNA glycosylase AlkD